MAFSRCKPCHGSGELMGGGMLKVSCNHCEGTGNIFKVDKNSSHYKNAIQELKLNNKMLTDAQANETFFETYAKIDKEDSEKEVTKHEKRSRRTKSG
jgi:DnaJ-class molecular chaperone